MLHIGQHWLKCLLDSGARHSFVSASIICELGFKAHFEDAFEVALADNSAVCSREVVDLPVRFTCNAMQAIACHILPSLHAPIILGMDWLRK